MRLEIADTPVSPQHLATRYKEARQRLLAAKPKPVKPSFSWSMHFNAGQPIRARWGNATPGINLTRISQAVCEHFQVTHGDLTSSRRTKTLVAPRHVVCFLARLYTGRSLPEIGRWLGKRDHTTILNSIRRVNARYDDFRGDIEAVKARLSID